MPSEQERERILRGATLALLVLLAGCSSAAVSPATPTPTPTETFVVNDNQATHSFEFRAGHEAPADWEFPITVEFQRAELGNWTEAYVFRVSEDDTLHLDLVEGEHYRIVVEDANGHRRALGLYTPTQRETHEVIEIFPCCDDTGVGA